MCFVSVPVSVMISLIWISKSYMTKKLCLLWYNVDNQILYKTGLCPEPYSLFCLDAKK